MSITLIQLSEVQPHKQTGKTHTGPTPIQTDSRAQSGQSRIDLKTIVCLCTPIALRSRQYKCSAANFRSEEVIDKQKSSGGGID